MEDPMRSLSCAAVAAAIGVLSCQGAGAVPVDAAGMRSAVAPTVEQTIYVRHTRHGIRKCFHDFIIGPYVCRTYHRWF